MASTGVEIHGAGRALGASGSREHREDRTLARPPAGLSEGDVIGRFRIGPIVGVGGHGVVYAARHVELGYPVALKVMDREAGRDPRRRARFRREAIVGARPRHRNVVSILDAGALPDGSPYLVMEHVSGVELARVLDELGPLPPAAAIELGLQLLSALAALDEHGIVHRDIKPQNVMLAQSADGEIEVKLLDFGIVKAPPEEAPTLTQEGFVLGTPHYMSPEQIRGLPLDGRSDLYAVGALLYETLTGVTPVQEDDAEEVLTAMLVQPAPLVTQRAPACPAQLEKVVSRALAKRRDARYQTPLAMADALRRAAEAHSLPRGVAAWTQTIPALERARRNAKARTEAPRRRDSTHTRVTGLGSPEVSRHYLPTPPERPSALRARRGNPRLPPPWWPTALIVTAILLALSALASSSERPTEAETRVELAAPAR